jgi:hypothetical protein
LQHEESAAARRYSPMNLSPSSPYNGTQQGTQAYTSFTPQQPQSSRQSPIRNNPYMSPPNSYYSPPGKRAPGQWLSSFSADVLIRCLCSITAACAPVSAPPVDHEPRELLSTVCYCPAQCRLQS